VTDEPLVAGVEEEGARSPRAVIADFTRDNEAEIVSALREGLKVTKQVSVLIECKSCKKSAHYTVPVPDAKSVAALIQMMIDQGFGKPATEVSAEESQTIVNYRVVHGGHEIAKRLRALAAEGASPSPADLTALCDEFGYQEFNGTGERS
jgi:hypothetical protein